MVLRPSLLQNILSCGFSRYIFGNVYVTKTIPTHSAWKSMLGKYVEGYTTKNCDDPRDCIMVLNAFKAGGGGLVVTPKYFYATICNANGALSQFS